MFVRYFIGWVYAIWTALSEIIIEHDWQLLGLFLGGLNFSRAAIMFLPGALYGPLYAPVIDIIPAWFYAWSSLAMGLLYLRASLWGLKKQAAWLSFLLAVQWAWLTYVTMFSGTVGFSPALVTIACIAVGHGMVFISIGERLWTRP